MSNTVLIIGGVALLYLYSQNQKQKAAASHSQAPNTGNSAGTPTGTGVAQQDNTVRDWTAAVQAGVSIVGTGYGVASNIINQTQNTNPYPDQTPSPVDPGNPYADNTTYSDPGAVDTGYGTDSGSPAIDSGATAMA